MKGDAFSHLGLSEIRGQRAAYNGVRLGVSGAAAPPLVDWDRVAGRLGKALGTGSPGIEPLT